MLQIYPQDNFYITKLFIPIRKHSSYIKLPTNTKYLNLISLSSDFGRSFLGIQTSYSSLFALNISLKIIYPIVTILMPTLTHQVLWYKKLTTIFINTKPEFMTPNLDRVFSAKKRRFKTYLVLFGLLVSKHIKLFFKTYTNWKCP